ncbi:MAG: hypothetical protein Q9M48_04280 [Rhodobacterales bacterium]|nr:hypothetical protein [Rhodobacterales bacterium]
MNIFSPVKQPMLIALGGMLLTLAMTAAPQVNAQTTRSGLPTGATSGFEVGVSTLGIYISPKFAISNKLAVRVPLYTGNTTDTFTYDGNTVTAALDATAFAVMADFHPWQNGFRVSAGAGFGGYSATGNITNPTLSGTTFAGTFAFAVNQKSNVVPVVSIGYVRPLGRRVSILAELGAKIGTYEVVTTGNTLDPLLQPTFDAEVANVNSDLSDVKAIPFATLGIQINF